jgi:hypothetical protein
LIVPRENTAWHTRSLGVNRKKQSITLVGNLSEIQRKVILAITPGIGAGGIGSRPFYILLALFDYNI